jgi:alkylation response protein AidB-like acyl-CoA dehydrogenase
MTFESYVRELSSRINHRDWKDPSTHIVLQRQLCRTLGTHGLLRVMTGLAYDDDGNDEQRYDYAYCYSLVSAFAKRSMPITAAVFTSSRIGIHAVMHAGSEEMRQQYVPACLSGEESWSLCMSGPEAGSDLLAGETTALRRGDAWVLNGHKKWITGGWYADYFCVLARTDATGTGTGTGSSGRGSVAGFSMFVVPRTASGVRVDRMVCNAAAESGSANVLFEDVVMSDRDVIGVIGQGFTIAMDLLVEERWVSGITSLAMARRSLDEVLEWTQTRQIHGKPMHRLQAVRLRVARMKMLLDPLDALARQLAVQLSMSRNKQQMSIALAADCAGFKATATLALTDCVQHAMLLFGGRAFEAAGKGGIIGRLHAEVHGMACAGGTYDVLMDGVARSMLLSMHSSL